MSETKTHPRVIFMGTSEFSVPILDALMQSTSVVAIYTRPDKPLGRDRLVQDGPVKKRALASNLPVMQPEHFDEATLSQLRDLKPDLIVVASYGKILPQAVLALPHLGCINVHPSLLPKFRGPSPIQNALLSGETETGTSIMLMDAGMDSGDILAQATLPIEPDEMHTDLSKRLSNLSAELLLTTLPLWINGSLSPHKQDESRVTLCQLIEREDGHILWTADSGTLYNAYRALSPWPGIYGFWRKEDGQIVRIKFIRITKQKHSPQTTYRLGEVFELGEKVGVRAAEGVIFLEEVQLEGKKVVPIAEFVKGYPSFIGSTLQ